MNSRFSKKIFRSRHALQEPPVPESSGCTTPIPAPSLAVIRPPQALAVLPNDVLHTIFQIFVQSRPKTGRRNDFSVILSHICKTWRELLLASSLLWAHVTMDRRNLNAEWLDTLFHRSGESLLHVSLLGAFDGGTSASRDHETVWRIITSHSARWESLEIRGVPLDACRILFEQLQTVSLPRLRSLSVARRSGLPYPPGFITLSPFQLPALKHLTLCSEGATMSFVSLTQLTTIRLATGLSKPSRVAEEVLGVLRAASGLRGLSLEALGCQRQGDHFRIYKKASTPRFRHSCLELLDVCHPGAVDIILQSVELPSLRRLPQQYNWPPELLHEINPTAAMPNLERVFLFSQQHPGNLRHDLGAVAQCAIRDISLHRYRVSPWSIEMICASFPGLESLDLFCCQGLTLNHLQPLMRKLNLTRLCVSPVDTEVMTMDQRRMFASKCTFNFRSPYPIYHHAKQPQGWETLL